MSTTSEGSNEPLVTVVVCCYSGRPYFEEAVASIVAQTLKRLKLVFHDNGCDPEYSDLIARVAETVGAQVIRSDVNRYGEGLRSDVLHRISTTYLAILHDDDMFEPGKLEASVDAIADNNADYLFTDRRYTDKWGVPLGTDRDEINPKPFGPQDMPYEFLGEIFITGLRFHFSTLLCKTSLALETALGDPYLPRIADSLFAARLLLDRRFRGVVLQEKLTRVRVHGGNDMLYDKFPEQDRGREMTLLSWAEYYIFSQIVDLCDDRQLLGVFSVYPGLDDEQRDGDRTQLLIAAAKRLVEAGRTKKLMAAHCIHKAFAREPYRTMALCRDLPGGDANRFMTTAYQNYTHDEVWTYKNFVSELTTEGVPRNLLRLGETVAFASAAVDPFLLFGVSAREEWGRWTDGDFVLMSFRSEATATTIVLELEVAMAWPGPQGYCMMSVSVSGGADQDFSVPSSGGSVRILIRPENVAADGRVAVAMRMLSAKRETEEPVLDSRKLGLGIRSMRVVAPEVVGLEV